MTTVEHYKELAIQEQSHPHGLLSCMRFYWRCITTNSPLEQLLAEDTTTFTSMQTRQFGRSANIKGVGRVFYVDVPASRKDGDDVDNETVVVFIHGLGASLHSFDHQIEEASRHCRVIAMDLPGSGLSSSKRPLTLDNNIHAVRQLLKKLDAMESEIILVGHAYGTQICIPLVTVLPHVETLLLLAPPEVGYRHSIWLMIKAWLMVHIAWLFTLVGKLQRANNIDSYLMSQQLAKDSVVSDYDKLKLFRDLVMWTPNVMVQYLKWKPLSLNVHLSTYDHLKSHGIPYVVLDGADDKITGDGGRSYRELLGAHMQYIKLDHAGHNMVMEKPNEISGMLRRLVLNCEHRIAGELDDEWGIKQD